MSIVKEDANVPLSLWRDIRKKAKITGTGAGHCLDWCLAAEDILRKKGYRGFQLKEENLGAGFLFHAWLERDVPEGTYVADGTAGQFDLQYHEGFYGLSRDASNKLKIVYWRA